MKMYNRSANAKQKKQIIWKMLLVVLLIGMIGIGMLGCAQKDASAANPQPEVVLTEETQYAETQAEPVEIQPVETKPWEAEDCLVTDVYFDDSHTDAYGNPCYFHIPQIHLDTTDVKRVNESFYKALYEQMFTTLVQNASSPQINGISYTWTVKDHFLSMIAAIRITDGDMLYHFSTLIDLDTGMVADLGEVLALYDMTLDDYYFMVQVVLDGELVKLNTGLDETLVDKNCADQLAATLSRENLMQVQPYIDAETGDLCIAANLFDIFCQNLGQFEISMTSMEKPTNPFAYRDMTKIWE